MHKASPTDMMMKKELKDAELDKKIEALRKKNEALMKRYQEVEEDKKRAEQEGMSLHCRKGKPDDLTITINKSCSEQRVVMKRSGSGDQNPRSEQEPADPAEPAGSVFSMGRGRRRQLLITTAANNKGKRVFGERKDRNRPVSPVRMKQCGDEEQNAECETAGRVKQLQSVKRVADAQTAETSVTLTDLNQPTSPEEQLEYLRWKKEREEIDRERVARHKNSRGQWRRAWDMEKTDVMFSEKANGRADRGAQNRGGRNVRRGNSRSGDESRGRVCDGGGKSVPVVGSKAKGKDRLTGRARRWDVKEQEEHLQVYPETSLEEFLEELDALCAPEQEKVSPETEKPLKTDETISDRGSEVKSGLTSAEEVHSEVSSLKATEKKVRFSVDVVDGAHEKNSNGVSTEIKTSLPKTPSRVTNGSVEENDKQTFTQHQDDGDRLREENADVTLACAEIKPPSPDQNQGNGEKTLPELNPAAESHETEPGEASGPRSSSEERRSVCTSAEPGQNQPVELMKSCTSRGNEELIDSSLCVLGLDSGDGLPDPSASADLARENGKVV